MSKKRTWNRTSASQHSAFQRCQRYWYYGWIERLPRPGSDAMQRGKDIHAEIEHYLLTGEIRDSCYSEFNLNYRPYVESMVPYLPEPMHDDLIVEHEINIDCGPGLPNWLGFIDLGFSGDKILKIRDTKTTSDFRYAKTEKELETNIQLVSYAEWVYQATDYKGPIDLGHLYVKTEKRLVRKKPMVKEVSVIVDEHDIHNVWDGEMEIVHDMVQISKKVKDANDLPPTISACGMYGGCPFREKCGISEMTLGGLFTLNKGKEKKTMGSKFLKKMKAKTSAKSDDEQKVLPEDAPSRTTRRKAKAKTEEVEEKPKRKTRTRKAKVKTDAEIDEEFDEAIEPEEKPKRKTRTRKAKAKVEEPEEEIEAAEEEVEEKPKAKAKRKPRAKKVEKIDGFVLYIDCMPKKGISTQPVLFEDWFHPMFSALDSSVKKENDGKGYWELGFAEQKHLIMEAVSMYIDEHGLPEALVVTSGMPLVKDVVPGLVPHATQVITSI